MKQKIAKWYEKLQVKHYESFKYTYTMELVIVDQ